MDGSCVVDGEGGGGGLNKWRTWLRPRYETFYRLVFAYFACSSHTKPGMEVQEHTLQKFQRDLHIDITSATDCCLFCFLKPVVFVFYPQRAYRMAMLESLGETVYPVASSPSLSRGSPLAC